MICCRPTTSSDRLRHQLWIPLYRANKPKAKVSQGIILDSFWLWSMQCGFLNAYKCIKQFFEMDFTDDLKKFDIPTLVLHDKADQIVPLKDSVRAARHCAALPSTAMAGAGSTSTPARRRTRFAVSSLLQSNGRKRSDVDLAVSPYTKPITPDDLKRYRDAGVDQAVVVNMRAQRMPDGAAKNIEEAARKWIDATAKL